MVNSVVVKIYTFVTYVRAMKDVEQETPTMYFIQVYNFAPHYSEDL